MASKKYNKNIREEIFDREFGGEYNIATMENQDTQKIIGILEKQGKMLEEHGKKFGEQEELLHFICETMGTLATKDELDGLKQKMNERFNTVDGRLGTVDGRLSTMEGQLSGIKIELAGIRKELDDIKLSLKKLENKTQEDDDAMISEIEKLKQRVAVLEKQLQVRPQMQAV